MTYQEPKEAKMDGKTRRERMLAAKATADVMRQKKMYENAAEQFAGAETVEQVLAYLAGGASVAWDKRPTGTFNAELASRLVDCAMARIDELIVDSIAGSKEALQRLAEAARQDSVGVVGESGTEAEPNEAVVEETTLKGSGIVANITDPKPADIIVEDDFR